MKGFLISIVDVFGGKYADIVAVRGDVLRHINLLQNVDIVINHGRRHK